MNQKDKLQMWQDRLAAAETAFSLEVQAMNDREAIYDGQRVVHGLVERDHVKETAHVRNIASELIESQVMATIPQPQVRARRKEDEWRAKLIEDMLRNELDRLPMEEINDMLERTVPIQGAGAFWLEWDNLRRTHTTVGELVVAALHPRQLVPQDGVTSGVEEMDYIFLKIPQTRQKLEKKYGVDLEGVREEEPEIRGAEANTAPNDMVTQYIAYYRNKKGGIGIYSWCGDTLLCDIEDYQARRVRRCRSCGAAEPISEEGEEKRESMPLSERLRTMFGRPRKSGERANGPVCEKCGSRDWADEDEAYEEVWEPIRRRDGMSEIPGATYEEVENEDGTVSMEMRPTRIPYYKPDIYPIILQKNVSVYGQFLGGSDIDRIRDQQNTTNRISEKIIEKIFTAGSVLTLPDDAKIRVSTEEGRIVRLKKPDDKTLIGTYNMEIDISQDMAYMAQVYEEARQEIGITDSFQGRRDTTAKSGKAKEFSAAQSAGRLESKRVMKEAAYARLFEAMFKFKLAYADEPRPVVAKDIRGNIVYEQFDRYDFLEQDAAGEWYWNDQFIFSCDTTAPLANNREAMWQETRQNLQSGAYGDPTQIETQIHFWSQMELLHYPGASETKTYMQEQLERQQAQMQQAQMQQAQMQQAQMSPEMIVEQARMDAARDAGMPVG